METCEKCRRKYEATRSTPNCPHCSERETQTITAADVDSGSILSAIADGLASVADAVSDAGSSISDSFDGGGGDFGGGGASGDW